MPNPTKFKQEHDVQKNSAELLEAEKLSLKIDLNFGESQFHVFQPFEKHKKKLTFIVGCQSLMLLSIPLVAKKQLL